MALTIQQLIQYNMDSDYAQVTLFNKRFLTLLIDDDFNHPDFGIENFKLKGDPNHYCIEDKTEVSHPLRVTLSLLGRKRTEAISKQDS